MRSTGSQAGLAVLQRYSLSVAEADDSSASDNELVGTRASNSTSVVTAVKGKPLLLHCVFGGRQTQTIQWYHQSRVGQPASRVAARRTGRHVLERADAPEEE